jgi:hypothetical protein
VVGGGGKSQGQGYSFASFLSYYFILAKVAKSWKSPGSCHEVAINYCYRTRISR